ncbi:hypothetical protein [Parasutterella excrementihominis]|uniref:hypothetical protein n=1 Tax=Parasutterella excrementihominis TaxID=487175 RepID=UPI0012BC1B1B|nr:hypothetical protein [Parasutterella excrementihominis]MTT64667.1 hypothetical protein [Parasutterella excrementihominis]MTT92988.1 hypothetical protein [Parasutterella excrementihominis]DAT59866.1 MAG TPA: hypothetical protein [Caudoviricetes sp.]
MARYKKIDVRIWNDAKFNALSSDARLIFLFMLTSPQTTMVGAVPVDKHTVSRILKFDEIRYGIGYKQLSEYGMLEYDEAGIFWIKNFLKYNPPENPKVVISWSSLLDLFPECQLLIKIAKSVLKACETRGEAYVKALHPEFKKLAKYDMSNGMPYGITYPMPYQEQEQEQEQDIYTHTEAKEEKTTLATDSQGRNIYDLEPNEIVPSELLSDYATARINSYLPEKKSEEKLPAPEQTEIVETAPASSKPKTEEKTQSRGVASKTQTSVAKPDDVSNELWADFLNHRKQKKAPVTDRVISLIRNEAKNAGWTLEEALNEVILRNWIGFKAEWVEAKDPNAVWVKAEDYQPELPPVEYAPSARECFDRIMAKSTYAYDIKDLSQLERVVKKEAK